ncbi:MAG: exodeoxyribonuclease VII large subunit [Candidatus Phytoplasma vitis]|nr:MAG: hypothetical protein M6G77_00195 [Candidatus Phytoplasma vitis]
MKYSIEETCVDVADFLERIDEFKDKYKNNKLPLIKGYIKRNQNDYVITSQKNDNKHIKITGPSFKIEMIDQNIIIQSNLIYKSSIYQLEIIYWLLIENITYENYQKNIKAIESDSKIGILTNGAATISDIEWELRKANYKNYEFFKVITGKIVAIDDICKKIQELNDNNQCDIILLSRGGGDESEINNVFNNLDIIASIKKSKIPIVTGIGHAFNTTFSDLVAYDNATTPTTGIQKVLWLIKFVDKVKNNYENNNDKLLDLHLGKIIQKIIDYSLKTQNNLIQKEEALTTAQNTLTQKKEELRTIQNNLIQKEEALTTAQNTLTQKKEELRTIQNNLTQKEESLTTAKNDLIQQKIELRAFQNTLTQKEKDLFTTKKDLIRFQYSLEYSRITKGIVDIEFSNENILIDIYNEDKNIIILNWVYLIKILNQYNFQIHFLYDNNIKSNLNLERKVLYLNKEELQKTIVFQISDDKPTNYNHNQKLLFINKNIIIKFPE